jgi:hypothetical protein
MGLETQFSLYDEPVLTACVLIGLVASGRSAPLDEGVIHSRWEYTDTCCRQCERMLWRRCMACMVNELEVW